MISTPHLATNLHHHIISSNQFALSLCIQTPLHLILTISRSCSHRKQLGLLRKLFLHLISQLYLQDTLGDNSCHTGIASSKSTFNHHLISPSIHCENAATRTLLHQPFAFCHHIIKTATCISSINISSGRGRFVPRR